MKDVFIIVIVVWLLYRLFNGTQVFYSNNDNFQSNEDRGSNGGKPEGSVSIDYIPPKEKKQQPTAKKKEDKEDDYVDYEEIK